MTDDHADLVALTAGALAGIEANPNLVSTTRQARGKSAVEVARAAQDRILSVESLEQSATIAMNGHCR